MAILSIHLALQQVAPTRAKRILINPVVATISSPRSISAEQRRRQQRQQRRQLLRLLGVVLALSAEALPLEQILVTIRYIVVMISVLMAAISAMQQLRVSRIVLRNAQLTLCVLWQNSLVVKTYVTLVKGDLIHRVQTAMSMLLSRELQSQRPPRPQQRP